MATFTPDTDNKMFQLAIQLVNQSNRNIFLTGKAGTGKTTFLKYIRNHCPKQMAVIAPTGVAAINAGGVTIHSFFQLPLEPFFPEPNSRHQLISRLRFNSEKKKIFQELEILVIDEISMVRCDILDAIDTVLRHVRQRNQMFGGVQLLFIGDMLQLPPVIKDHEWNQLTEFYSGLYFFDSLVLKEEPPVYIEFNKIYRQSDERFINVLNQVRNNELDEDGLSILESRYQPNFRRNKKDGYIILTTHNNKANSINIEELADIDNKIYSYQADVVEEFSERAYPADELLQLKEGAQVMFIRNDSAENGKRFFNGKIGTVAKLDDEKIFVQCEDEPFEIEVQKEKWENIRYTLDKSTRKLDSEVLGSFTQFPLRLAWAITIHKSQGLTFEKAIIDAGEAFAAGQVYVALSRCTNLEGMVLQSRIQQNRLFSDRRIVEFSQRSATSGQLENELAIAKKHYQQAMLIATFDFAVAINSTKELLEYLVQHSSSFNAEAISWTEELLSKLDAQQETARKFQTQLQWLFQQKESPEENKPLQERIIAAAKYFIAELNSLIQYITKSPSVTDSRLNAKEYNETLRELFAQLSMKKFMLEGFNNRFDMEAFHRRKQKFVLPSFTVNAYAGATQKRADTPHPNLHQQLRKLRETICVKKDLPIYIVAGTNTIDEMARYLPQSLSELKKVSGFGDVKIEQYGQQFLDVILQYTEEKIFVHSYMKKSQRENEKKKVRQQKRKVVLTKKLLTYIKKESPLVKLQQREIWRLEL
ncbi:MAG: HRDC domain-containing protein [Chitinophagaceae bacterium]|nr:HRDC domain-containing protein [Chitinophagaceae bacterium]